MQRGVI